jgi:hypothetical protein
MGKTWVLDSETKGTGANMVPLEKTQKKADEPVRRASRGAKGGQARRPAGEARQASRATRTAPPQTTSTALPPGHVRKKSNGDIGKVKSVDARAGTAVVQWLRGGHTSTVPLSAISRR